MVPAELEQDQKARNDSMAANARGLMLAIAKLGPPDTKLADQMLLKNSGTYRACYFAGFLPPGSRPPAELTPEDRRVLGVRTPACRLREASARMGPGGPPALAAP